MSIAFVMIANGIVVKAVLSQIMSCRHVELVVQLAVSFALPPP